MAKSSELPAKGSCESGPPGDLVFRLAPQPEGGALKAPPPRAQETHAGRWERLLLPSFSDFLFLSILFWLFAVGKYGWVGLLGDADTGWHIRTGEFILDHRRVPVTDLFSFSKAGETWFAWEWLSDVVLAAVFRAASLKGVVLLAGVCIALAGILVFRRMMWRGADPFVALAVALLGVSASSVHYLARPHVLTLLLLAVSVWILDADRRRPSRAVWLLVPLTALWTNLHGGFLALIACIGLLAAGSAVEGWIGGTAGKRWRQARRYGGLGVACAAATFVNPYGYHLHAHMLAYLRSDWIRKMVEEFQSPSFRSENMRQFEILLVLGFASAAWLVRRKQITDAAWIVFWLHASLVSVRHIPVFTVVAAPLVASELSAGWEKWSGGRSRKSLLGILQALARDLRESFRRTSAWAPLAVIVLALVNQPMNWPRDFPEEKFPVKTSSRHAGLLTSSKLLTSDQWADYLIFRFYPRIRVFIDGRSDFYGPPIGDQYIHVAQGRWDWEQVLNRHGFDAVLIPVEWPLASLLKQSPAWRLIEDDGRAVLFVRSNRTPVAAEKNAGAALMKSWTAAERHRGDHQS